jgi:5-methylcytosine-specific restriction protein A
MPKRIAAGCQHPSRCSNPATNGKYCAVHAKHAASIYEAQRGTAAGRGYDYRWMKISRAVLEEEPICCDPFRVGCRNRSSHTDHIVPRRQGGSDERFNLQALCSGCHSAKTLLEQKVKFTFLCGCDRRTRIGVKGNEVTVACDDHAHEGMLMHVRCWPLILKDISK